MQSGVGGSSTVLFIQVIPRLGSRDPRGRSVAMITDPLIDNDCYGGGPGICWNGLLVYGMLKLDELLGGRE